MATLPAQLKKSLVGFEIRMYGPQTPEEAYSMKQSLDWWKTVGFSEPQPVGTYGERLQVYQIVIPICLGLLEYG